MHLSSPHTDLTKNVPTSPMTIATKDATPAKDAPAVALTPAPIETVVVHPLVLLSVVDHYTRIDKVSSQRRVVGCLLGARKKGASRFWNLDLSPQL